MPRNRFVFTAPIVLAVIIIGVFAIRSRGDDSSNVDTTQARNCPPVARADTVATKPGTPISIDVLANDTDPDGDPLVFQIRTATGGDATNDDGGTPTDAGDDRIAFTPADPAPPQATIDYQAIDPEGAMSEATVTIAINADGALPAGVASEPVPSGPSGSGGRCGGSGVTTSTTQKSPSTTGRTTNSTTTPVTDEFGTVTPAHKPSSKPNGHTPTTRKSTATTTKSPGTTEPSSDTTQPHTTTTVRTTTTQPSGPPATAPPECGEPQNTPEYKQCVRDHSG